MKMLRLLAKSGINACAIGALLGAIVESNRRDRYNPQAYTHYDPYRFF